MVYTKLLPKIPAMRSWYEFGYNGFPSGEQRRRFYRQRDDPCDSEEECDYDDKTNDRPIFYYPLRPSEEGQRSSSSVPLSPSTGSDEGAEDEPTADNGARRTLWSSAHYSHRSSRIRSVSHEKSSLCCLLHSTLYEDMPAWYGSSSITLNSVHCPHEVYSLQYGGAACASPFDVSNQFSLWRWSSLPVTGASTPENEAAGNVHCARFVDDSSLLSCLRWSSLHPALRLAHTSSLRTPGRIGHCAAPLPFADAAVLQYFLSDHRQGTHATEASRHGSKVYRFSKRALENTSDLLTSSDVDIHVSLVIGGASHLVDMSNSSVVRSRHGGSGSHRSWAESDSKVFRGPNLDRVAIERSHLLSHPALCLTLIAHSVAQPRQHTVYFSLDGPSVSLLSPRAFATLNSWPDTNGEALALRSFAYIGGTDNGRDPLPYLEVELFQLNLDTWVWSTFPIATYGARPPPRFGHSVTMAQGDGCLLMFGGVGAGRTYLNDLHILDLNTRVWREVFIPFGVNVPRRAFFTAAVMTLPDAPLRERGRSKHSTSTDSDITTFVRRAAESLTRESATLARWGQSAPSSPPAAHQDVSSGDELEGDDDVLSSRVTSAQSRGVLVLLGGECEGKPVTSGWACILRSGCWRRLSFPLRTQPHFSHVARSCVLAEGSAVRAGHSLSRINFRTAMQTLMEQVLHPASLATPGSRTHSNAVHEPYMAVCHGSLGQVVLFPQDSGSAERLVLRGGSQGPSMSVVSEMSFMGTSLKESVSLWLLTTHQQRSLSSVLSNRVQHLHLAFFHRNIGLSRAAKSILQSDGDKPARSDSVSAENACFDRHLSSCVLEGQLMEWTQLARKRLREES
ncbi:hypothetical protein JKF63_03640 [Porcisia hertigi]|uniref:Uncharacterized protein n=1 Tax=Porcisia hertigi TaxID=2761500 RepID=A0A836ILN4_9TRYP|nr:hypothetical protein JKF63_03640 [Porcisia hertigi]